MSKTQYVEQTLRRVHDAIDQRLESYLDARLICYSYTAEPMPNHRTVATGPRVEPNGLNAPTVRTYRV